MTDSTLKLSMNNPLVSSIKEENTVVNFEHEFLEDLKFELSLENLEPNLFVTGWKECISFKPDDSGYYMTHYFFNVNKDLIYEKAIYYNHLDCEWKKWRSNLPDFTVIEFLPSSKSEYYTECLRKVGALNYEQRTI